MPEGDRFGAFLLGPKDRARQPLGEIAACPRRELQCAPTLVRILNSLRRLQHLAAFGRRTLKRFQARLGDEIRMRRDRAARAA